MADGVLLNAGAGGETAATDDCGAAGQVQIVKLAIATDGSATVIPGTAATGLYVNPTDAAARDNGKIDIATIDQYTPEDVDSGGGTVNALPIVLKVAGAGGVTITGDAANGLDVDVTRLPALVAGDNNIGNVDIVTVPADPFGANADVASATGSISAKLRFIAGTGIPITGTVTVGSHAVTNAGTFAVQADLTKIAGAAVVVAGGTEATALRVTLANDSTGLLSVDDNGGSLTVDVGTALPAGTNTIGGVIAQQSSSILYDGTTACTVKRVSVANPADGATLIAGVADKKFRVLAFAIFTESATVTNFWLEDADGADVFGDSTGIPLITTGATGAGGLVLQWNPGGWFQTATANKNLVIQLTSAQPVVVCITYIEVA